MPSPARRTDAQLTSCFLSSRLLHRKVVFSTLLFPPSQDRVDYLAAAGVQVISVVSDNAANMKLALAKARDELKVIPLN
jgi:hypothetical protein